ncbi:MAG: 5-formyltetrahydrofolate cyclo-ligase [Proteobacteria bacterium]|nr:5-formyltetrahydrofolate cyclo-ligase [Pseudomonadota bacterium]
MNLAATQSTARIRTAAKRARRSIRDDARTAASAEIASHIMNSREFLASRTLACYLHDWDEVDTRAIIERAWCAKKRVFAPVIDRHGGMRFHALYPETRLEQNQFGLWEPIATSAISPRELDVVITPVVAFDDDLNRIGMGGGHFDRCFAFLRNRKRWLRPKLIGVAFDCQRVEKITPNPWDVRLYRIISEAGPVDLPCDK